MQPKITRAKCSECGKELDKDRGDKIFTYDKHEILDGEVAVAEKEKDSVKVAYFYCDSCALKWVKPEFLVEL